MLFLVTLAHTVSLDHVLKLTPLISFANRHFFKR